MTLLSILIMQDCTCSPEVIDAVDEFPVLAWSGRTWPTIAGLLSVHKREWRAVVLFAGGVVEVRQLHCLWL